jgi:uncharacterized protein YfiM (DUF2279 family)
MELSSICRKALAILTLWVVFAHVYAQDSTLAAPKRSRVWWAAGATGVTAAVGIAGLATVWYGGQERGAFRTFNDNREWLQMDKAGHLFSGYQLTRYGFEVWQWAGVNDKKALLAGAAGATVFLTAIELLDGHAPDWGFSWGDVAANTAGAGLYGAQQLLCKQQYVLVKFSYRSSTYAGYRPERLGSNHTERLVKDYNGHTYWLSLHVAPLLSSAVLLPPWLHLAVGYSARGMLGGLENPPFNAAGEALPFFDRERVWMLSLDVDLSRIPSRKAWVRTLCSTFGFIKVPAPAIAIQGGRLKAYGFYF